MTVLSFKPHSDLKYFTDQTALSGFLIASLRVVVKGRPQGSKLCVPFPAEQGRRLSLRTPILSTKSYPCEWLRWQLFLALEAGKANLRTAVGTVCFGWPV